MITLTPVRVHLITLGVTTALVIGALCWWAGSDGQAGPPPLLGAASAPVPVVTRPAVTATVPVYLEGLGTVQASALVTVRSQVDGKLLEVRFREGQEVRAGDVLARIDPRIYKAQLDQAIARKTQDEKALANARLEYNRYQSLANDKVGSVQRAEAALSTMAQLAAQVEQDQAQLDRARAEMSFTTITAPIDGRLGMLQTDPGNVVRATDPAGLVVLTAMRPIAVVFTLPQQRLAQVMAAMKSAMPEALALEPSGDHAVLDRGRLAVLDNQVDQSTGTIKLKALFPNADLQLWPGAYVNVKLLVATLTNVVTVPPLAIQRGPEGPYVYVVDKQAVSRQPVRIGYQDQSVAVVTSGLSAGAQLVTEGAERLTDGTAVTVLSPAAAPPGPIAAGKP